MSKQSNIPTWLKLPKEAREKLDKYIIEIITSTRNSILDEVKEAWRGLEIMAGSSVGSRTGMMVRDENGDWQTFTVDRDAWNKFCKVKNSLLTKMKGETE